MRTKRFCRDWREVVGEVLHGLGLDGTAAGSVPRAVMALNKADRLSPNERLARLREDEARGWGAAGTSAVTSGGVEGLRTRLAGRPRVTASLPTE